MCRISAPIKLKPPKGCQLAVAWDCICSLDRTCRSQLHPQTAALIVFSYFNFRYSTFAYFAYSRRLPVCLRRWSGGTLTIRLFRSPAFCRYSCSIRRFCLRTDSLSLNGRSERGERNASINCQSPSLCESIRNQLL